MITKSVEADSLAVTRSEQRGLAGWAKKFRLPLVIHSRDSIDETLALLTAAASR